MIKTQGNKGGHGLINVLHCFPFVFNLSQKKLQNLWNPGCTSYGNITELN